MHKRSVKNSLALVAAPAVVFALALPLGGTTTASATARAVPATAAIPRAAGPKSQVIVLLKDNEPGLAARSTRSRALRSEEAPLLSELRDAGATVQRAGSAIPYLLASVTAAQRSALQHNPLVRLVVANSVVRFNPSSLESGNSAAVPALTRAGKTDKTAPDRAATTYQGPSICGSATHPEVDPEAITSAAINSVGANALGYDGAGVTVAYIAGGIDSTIPDFQRNAAYASAASPAGSQVVTPVNFSGDPTADQAGGAAIESFLDASSIAAQGNETYDLGTFVNSTHSLPSSPCDITITGAAPGANVLGLDVFSDNYDTTESNFIQAIDFAVNAGVKVINESFGSDNFPDSALDATKIADDDAVAAGVTVVVSAGDSGVGSTLGSPATDPNLISAGASTTFRTYEQDFYGGINATTPNSNNGTWIDNNISSISSSGFAQSGGNTVDVVAPGDLNWIECSSNAAEPSSSASWADLCPNENGVVGSPFTFEGGTSEAAPLTSAAAADVIQAYSSTHGGADPSPALIKKIIMSTATDVNAPAEEQGAGLLNVLAAVKEAASLPGTSGTPQGGLLVSPNQINITQNPKASTKTTISVTNTGDSSATVDLSTRALTKSVSGGTQDGTFCMNPSSTATTGCPVTSNSFQIWSGVTEVYQEETFTVPATTSPSRLEFSATYPVDNPEQNSLLHVALYDPTGAYAGYSLPQGLADFEHAEVADPAAGTWTAVFFTVQDTSSSSSACGNAPCVGTSGTIHWSATTSEFAAAGKISPSTLTIPAGATKTATFTDTSPANSGDTAQSIVLSTVGGPRNTIPVTTRTLVPIGKNGGSFTGMLTGGNGRGNPADTNTYEFTVPKGERDLDVSAAFTNKNVGVAAFLIDPEGESVASSSSVTLNSTGTEILDTGGVNIYKDAPQAGRWLVVLDWLPPEPPFTGTETQALSQIFTGAVRFNEVSVKDNLPHSFRTDLKRGKSYSLEVTVKNTGVSPQAFFLDPRTASRALVPLADINGSEKNMSLPLGPGTTFPVYSVPPDSTGLVATLKGSQPVTFDTGPFTGDPDLSPALPAYNATESQSGDSASLKYISPGGELSPGLWYLNPSEVGPYVLPSGAPPATASASFSVVTHPFNSTVTTQTGDLWSYYNGYSKSFTPIYVMPGKSVRIRVTIKPTAAPGKRVRGVVNVDDTFLVNLVAGELESGGDELASLPFNYTVAK